MMARARVLQNLSLPVANYSARYLIEFDLGSEQQAAALAKLGTLLASNEVQTGEFLAKLAARQAEEEALRAAQEAAEAAYIAAASVAGPDAPLPPIKPLNDARQALVRYRLASLPLRTQREALRVERARLLRAVAAWNSFNPISTQSAWALSFAQDIAGLTVGSDVWTGETNGVQGLSYILGAISGGAAPALTGELVARDVMTPEQVFFNAAVLPGWQRFKPTIRTGVVTAVYSAPKGLDVALDAATSTPIALDINPDPAVVLRADCIHDADAYMTGDQVIVAFPSQSFDVAQVVGWSDGPKRLPADISLPVGLVWFNDLDGSLVPHGSAPYTPPGLAGLPTFRVTRQNPTAVMPVPNLTPDAVHLGSNSTATRNFADRFSEDPRVVPSFAPASYYSFPRSFSPARPSVGANYFGSVGFNALTETFFYFFEIGLFDPLTPSNNPLLYPRSYVGNLITYTQTVESPSASGSGFASRAAAIAHLEANYDPEIDIEAEFPNGQTVQLVCRKNGALVDPFGNGVVQNLEIVSCTPDRITYP